MEGEMDWRDRVELNPDVLAGKPVVKGTRVAVELVIDLLAHGWSEREIAENYDISSDDIHACLAYAGEVLREQRAYPLGA